MSRVSVTDSSGGRMVVTIHFTYGECERLPFNLLRRIGAEIRTIHSGGAEAEARFNIRERKQAAQFLRVLDLFGEGGSFQHGSSADPDSLSRQEPPEGEDGSQLRVSLEEQAGAVSALPEIDTEPLPSSPREAIDPQPSLFTEAVEQGPREIVVEDDSVFEDEEDGPDANSHASSDDWQDWGDRAVAESLTAGEQRTETLARVRRTASPAYSESMVRSRMTAILLKRLGDEEAVRQELEKRGWAP